MEAFHHFSLRHCRSSVKSSRHHVLNAIRFQGTHSETVGEPLRGVQDAPRFTQVHAAQLQVPSRRRQDHLHPKAKLVMAEARKTAEPRRQASAAREWLPRRLWSFASSESMKTRSSRSRARSAGRWDSSKIRTASSAWSDR